MDVIVGEQLSVGKIANNHSGGVWFSMEKDWANALKEVPPKKVSVKIFPSYQGDSIRPTKFRIEYQIEGEELERLTIKNQTGG
jgi:hypothetical protein